MTRWRKWRKRFKTLLQRRRANGALMERHRKAGKAPGGVRRLSSGWMLKSHRKMRRRILTKAKRSSNAYWTVDSESGRKPANFVLSFSGELRLVSHFKHSCPI